jgi:peptide/nickel transport system ATP-binding protein
MKPLLEVQNLSVALPEGADRALALADVSFALSPGEILCVVGESGSGKSMAANTVMGLLSEGVAVTQGRILLDGIDLLGLDEAVLRKVRGARIAMIFQEPMTALNPLRTIGDQIGEMFKEHTELSKSAIKDRVLALLDEVRIPDPSSAFAVYPHELSGGQRQRAMIAMALALEPQVLIADEPTTALDVTTQAQILKLIRELQPKKGTAVLFITHDFGVVAEIADRIVVMQHGRVVETGKAQQVLQAPQHDYTKALIAAVPPLKAPPPRALSSEVVLAISGISKTYRSGGFLGRRPRITKALDDVSMDVPRGGTLGVVGESGSGKSTLAKAIVRLIDVDQGSIKLGAFDLRRSSPRERGSASAKVQMVFQDPFASLNPRRKAGDLVAQGPIAHGLRPDQAIARAAELFALVGLDPRSIDRYPHEFSGGQRQRIGIARALAMQPEVLVADEPVSALDVSVQAQVLRLLVDLRGKLGLSMVFITHDLRVAAQICDRIAIMKDGRVVEAGVTAEVFEAPQHDYTRALLASIPGRGLLEWTSAKT